MEIGLRSSSWRPRDAPGPRSVRLPGIRMRSYCCSSDVGPPRAAEPQAACAPWAARWPRVTPGVLGARRNSCGTVVVAAGGGDSDVVVGVDVEDVAVAVAGDSDVVVGVDDVAVAAGVRFDVAAAVDIAGDVNGEVVAVVAGGVVGVEGAVVGDAVDCDCAGVVAAAGYDADYFAPIVGLGTLDGCGAGGVAGDGCCCGGGDGCGGFGGRAGCRYCLCCYCGGFLHSASQRPNLDYSRSGWRGHRLCGDGARCCYCCCLHHICRHLPCLGAPQGDHHSNPTHWAGRYHGDSHPCCCSWWKRRCYWCCCRSCRRCRWLIPGDRRLELCSKRARHRTRCACSWAGRLWPCTGDP